MPTLYHHICGFGMFNTLTKALHEIVSILQERVYNGEGEYRTTLYAVKNEPVKSYGIVQATR